MPFYCPIKLELASLLPSTDATAAAAAASTSLLLSLSAFLRQLSLFCFCYCFPLCEINKWNKLCSSVSRILHRDYTNILSVPVPCLPSIRSSSAMCLTLSWFTVGGLFGWAKQKNQVILNYTAIHSFIIPISLAVKQVQSFCSSKASASSTKRDVKRINETRFGLIMI